MTLDSTKGTNLGAEPAPDSSKNDLLKIAETEKNLDDLIVSLKAKLVRSRADDTKPSNSKRNERHALSRDRHHRLRDTRPRCHVRSDNRSRGASCDRTSDWSDEHWHRSRSSRDRSHGILSRELSCDAWSDVKMTERVVGINDGDCSEKITDVKGGHLRSLNQKITGLRRSFAAKDDVSDRTKLGERKVSKIPKIETPEMRQFKPNQISGQIREFMSYSKQVFERNCSEKEKRNKIHLRPMNKMQLSAANKLQLQTSPTTMNYNRRQTDVFKNDSRSQRRRKKKRKFLKTIYKDFQKIHKPASRLRSEKPESRKNSTGPSSVDQEAEVIRLKADRLRLDRFRGGLKLYASAVQKAQSKLQGLLHDLSTVSPSTLLCEGEGEKEGEGVSALGVSTETDFDGNCNSDVEGDMDNLVADSDGRCNYGESNNEHDRYGDDNDSKGDHGDDEVRNGGHDDSENGNGGQGDDGEGNGSHGHDKDESGTHGDDNWGHCNDGDGTDRNCVGKAYCDNYGNAKECNGCHGPVNDKGGSLSGSGADQLQFWKHMRVDPMQGDTEVAATNDEASLHTPLLELSAPALVPQSLMPDSLDLTKPDPPSPPILKSIKDLYGNSQNFDEVLPLTRQQHPVTWWPPSVSFVPLSSAAVKSETPTTTVDDRLYPGRGQADDSFRPLEANYSSPSSKEPLISHSSPVSKEQLVSQIGMGQINTCPVSEGQLINHSYPVSKEELVNHSSLVSKELLVSHIDLEQIHSSPFLREQLTRRMDPDPNNSSPVSREQIASKLEESFTPESSFSAGHFEKDGNQDEKPILSLGEKFDSELIRERYAKATSALSKLTSILSVRRKSKLMVDAKLESLRRELFRLRVNFFVEKSKLSDETKTGFSKDYGSSDVQLETTCHDRKLDVTNHQLDTFYNSYLSSTNDKQLEKTDKIAQLKEEGPVKILSILNKDKPSDKTKCNLGLSPEFLSAGESAVDLSTKVYRKPEVDVKSDWQGIQDVVCSELEDSAGRANFSLMPISRHSVRGTQNGQSRSPDLSRSLEDVPLKDFDAVVRSESSDVGDDCSGRVLNLAFDKRAANSPMSLCPKKRLRQKYRDQTEQEGDNAADGTTHLSMVPEVHRVLEATLYPHQLDHVEYSRCLEQRCRGVPRPSRDLQKRQLASTPPGSLPSPTISGQKIAVVTAHFREAEKCGLPEQNEKIVPLNEASEPARKRRMMSKNRDNSQPVLSLQRKTRSRNDFLNKDPDFNRLSSHGNGITAYQTNGPTANQSNSLMANHNPSLTAKQMANLTANQPSRMSNTRRFQSSLSQAQMDSSSFIPSKSLAEFPNSGPIPLEIRSLHASEVAQWRAADSNKSKEYGSEIARNFPPAPYISPIGCVLPTYSFPSDPHDQSYLTYLANHSFEGSAVERGCSRLLDLRQPVPEHLMYSSVRVRPEDRGLLFSMGEPRQLLSSAAALMSPNSIPGFYRLPNGAYYGESTISPEYYMTTKNPYELTPF